MSHTPFVARHRLRGRWGGLRDGWIKRYLSIIALAGLVVLPGAPAQGSAAGTWSPTSAMNVPRVYHTATLLQNGAVLVTGGYFFAYSPSLHSVDQASAELYDPAAGTWSFTGSLATPRHSHTATLLADGQVLVAGGCCDAAGNDLASAELYDPRTGTFTATGSMSTAREDQSATLLPNGKVLVAGGSISETSSTATAELYDPATGTWRPTGSMHTARHDFAATLLPNGKVLVAGGEGCFLCPSTAAAELYDPATGTWSLTGSMHTARAFHTLTLLPNGQVLAAGGCSGSCVTTFSGITATAELYDPTTETWSLTGSMSNARIWHTATLLGTGEVLVAGGESPNRQPVGPSELYDPTSGSWSLTGSLNTARELHAATLLPGGQVLVSGGFGPPLSFGSQSTSTAELYQPFTPAVLSTSAMSGTPGQRIGLSGAGFAAGEAVKVFWDSTPTAPLVTPTATTGGSFAVTVTVPQAFDGAHTLFAVGQSNGEMASAGFRVTPAVVLLPAASGKAGSAVTMVGLGFGAGETVAALWYPGFSLLGHATSNAVGTAVVSFTVPAAAAGTYDVIGYGVSTRTAAVKSFTVTAASLSSAPSDRAQKPAVGPVPPPPYPVTLR